MENSVEKQIIDDWLVDNPLGQCEVFRAKLSKDACVKLKEKYLKKLKSYDYDSENIRVFYEICCYKCDGLTYK